MMGMGNLITGIAPAIGPTFGGSVASKLNWRWFFLYSDSIISYFVSSWSLGDPTKICNQETRA